MDTVFPTINFDPQINATLFTFGSEKAPITELLKRNLMSQVAKLFRRPNNLLLSQIKLFLKNKKRSRTSLPASLST